MNANKTYLELALLLHLMIEVPRAVKMMRMMAKIIITDQKSEIYYIIKKFLIEDQKAKHYHCEPNKNTNMVPNNNENTQFIFQLNTSIYPQLQYSM